MKKKMNQKNNNLVGKLIEIDKMCCLIQQHDPDWSSFRYLLLMPEDVDKNRRIRCDIDPNTNEFIGVNGQPHKVNIFSVYDIIDKYQSGSGNDCNCDDDSTKLLMASYVYFGIGDADMAEKCVKLGLSMTNSKKNDDRLMDFVRDIYKLKIKKKILNGGVKAAEDAMNESMMFSAESWDSVVRIYVTAVVLYECEYINNAVNVTKHAVEMLHAHLEELKKNAHSNNVEIECNRQLSKLIKDVHSLNGSLHHVLTSLQNEVNGKNCVIEEYSSNLSRTLLFEYNSFGLKCFYPLHGAMIDSSVHITVHFWAANVSLDEGLLEVAKQHVTAIFEVVQMEEFSPTSFENLAYDVRPLLKKYVECVCCNNNGTGKDTSVASKTSESTIDDIFSKTKLNDIQQAILLYISASLLTNYISLLSLALKYVDDSIAVSKALVSASDVDSSCDVISGI